MTAVLHHDILRPAQPTADPRRRLFVLHGIFGMGRNWMTVARRLLERRGDLDAVLVDLRMHGRSTGFAPPHDVSAVAGDVARLVQHLGGGEHAVLGHSFGGKVALRYAADAPAGLTGLFSIDSTPDAVSTKNQGGMMLQLLRRLPPRYASRDDAVAAMTSFTVSPPVAQWMATNLIRDESAASDPDRPFVWRFDLDDVDAMLADFYPATFWELVEAPQPPAPLHFVRASEGSIMTDATADRIRSAPAHGERVHLHPVRGDHWLNASNPDAIVDLLAEHA